MRVQNIMYKNITSLLKEEMISLDPCIDFPFPPENPVLTERYKWQCKKLVLDEVVSLFCRSGQVRNGSKLYRDLLNRERRATTAIGEGLAIPHVRTMQPRGLVICFVRCSEGVEFISLDEKPVHFIFGVITPPYSDKEYTECLSWLSRMFSECFWLKDSLMSAETPSEVREIMVTLSGQFS